MDFDSKTLLGSLSVIVAIGSYIPYFINIYRGHTKPHAFSWFIWALATGIIFVVQVMNGAGPGSWALGVSALACLLIAIAGLVVGLRTFDRLDWLALGLVIIALGLWWQTSEPLIAVLLITLADAIGFIPSLRKGWTKPDEETLSAFFIAAVKHTLSLFALRSYILTNTFMPAALLILNSLFVIVIYRQRLKLTR